MITNEPDQSRRHRPYRPKKKERCEQAVEVAGTGKSSEEERRAKKIFKLESKSPGKEKNVK